MTQVYTLVPVVDTVGLYRLDHSSHYNMICLINFSGSPGEVTKITVDIWYHTFMVPYSPVTDQAEVWLEPVHLPAVDNWTSDATHRDVIHDSHGVCFPWSCYYLSSHKNSQVDHVVLK